MTKPFAVPKALVWDAFQRVKANGGSAGIDDESIAKFEEHLGDNLYKLWNRMGSGSYFPPPVKAVPIPKNRGGMRMLGVPTVADRVAQTVVKKVLEPVLEAVFDRDSFGYRPGRSALDAVGLVRRRSWKYDWVVEFDIQGLFDNIDHALLLRAVRKHCSTPWVLLYIERWLKAPMETEEGTRVARERGTPQGGVVSPLLANLFLHYALDAWMRREMRSVRFCRYADGMPEQTLDARVKVPPPQLPVQGSSSEAALAGDRRGQVPRHRPQEVAAERQAAAQANPHVSLVIRTCGGRPTRLLGKAATSREGMGTCTAMAPPGCQGRHVAMVQGSKSGRSGRTTEQVAPVLGAYKADRRSGVGVRPEVGGARITRAGEDNTTSSMVKLAGGEPTARRREVFARGRGPASSDALDRASAL
jgi:hypothetical protein